MIANQSTRKAEVEPQTVYVLSGVMYLPHYFNFGVFVGPGYGQSNHKTYSGPELALAGARKREYPLIMSIGRKQVAKVEAHSNG